MVIHAGQFNTASDFGRALFSSADGCAAEDMLEEEAVETDDAEVVDGPPNESICLANVCLCFCSN